MMGDPRPTRLVAPEDGDVVVRQDALDETFTYVLRIAPGDDQICFRTRDEAVAQAVAFAKRRHARAWFTSHDHSVLLGTFRPKPVKESS